MSNFGDSVEDLMCRHALLFGVEWEKVEPRSAFIFDASAFYLSLISASKNIHVEIDPS